MWENLKGPGHCIISWYHLDFFFNWLIDYFIEQTPHGPHICTATHKKSSKRLPHQCFHKDMW